MDKDDVIATLRAHQAELEKLGVRHAALFGSVARGEAGPDSDIDIAIQLDETRLPGIYEFVGMTQQIAALFDGPVDVVERLALKPKVSADASADMIDAF